MTCQLLPRDDSHKYHTLPEQKYSTCGYESMCSTLPSTPSPSFNRNSNRCNTVHFFRRVRKIAPKRLLVSSCLSVRLTAWNNSAPIGRIFTKFNIWVFFENLSTEFKIHGNLTRIMGNLHDNLRKFMIISTEFFSGRAMFQTNFVDKIKTRIFC